MGFITDDRKGSITVEAAIVVPVVILILLPFLFLLRRLCFGLMFESDVQNALERLAAVSYVLEKADDFETEKKENSRQRERQQRALQDAEEKKTAYTSMEREIIGGLGIGTGGSGGEGTIGETLEDVFLEEAGRLYLYSVLASKWDDQTLQVWGVKGGWSGISLAQSSFFFADESRGYLMKAHVRICWASPVSFWEIPDSEICRVTHAFMGESHSSAASDEKKEAAEEEVVYRIGAGMRYHSMNCYLISKQKTSMTAETAEGRGLSPCQVCQGAGDVVYVSSGGDCYHSSSCRLLFPSLTGMTVAEAVHNGLTPCGLCFGGADVYFH